MRGLSFATFILLLAPQFLSGCSQREQEAKTAIQQILLDPESAQFSEVFGNPETGAVCGFVNAKNRMGGYVGKMPFMYHTAGPLKRAFILSMPDDADFEAGAHSGKWFYNFKDLAQRCRELPEWESACGQKLRIPHPTKYCAMINEGQDSWQVYRAAESAR